MSKLITHLCCGTRRHITFILLDEVGGSPGLSRYRRVGVGATVIDHWAGIGPGLDVEG